ncbi:MAG: hypothetical protein OIF36_03885 [Alphaproteobacteria bacterium]|nr:hypothetical protein [Alphaproteobacteria bacterium]
MSKNEDYRDEYLKMRDDWDEGRVRSRESFNKLISTLSLGGLTLSIAFIKLIPVEYNEPIWMYLSWSGFVLSILFLMLSYLLSEYTHKHLVEAMDRKYKETRNPFDIEEPKSLKIVRVIFNYITIISTILSIILFIIFVCLNNPLNKKMPRQQGEVYISQIKNNYFIRNK